MQKNNLIDSWKRLYTQHYLDVEFFKEQSALEKNLSLPKINFYSLEFNSDAENNLSNLNLFTLLGILKSFCELKNVKNKHIFMHFDENISPFLVRKAISLINYNVENIYLFNSENNAYKLDLANDFVVYQVSKAFNLDYVIFLQKNKVNNKYYLKIYKKNFLLSTLEYEEILEHFKNSNHDFVFKENIDNNKKIDINKIIESAILPSEINLLKKSQWTNDSLIVSMLVASNLDEKILTQALEKANYKVIKYTWNLHKKLSKWKKYSLQKFLNNSLNKSDVLVILDANHKLKLVIRTKKGFRLLSDDEIIFIYVSYFYLSLKKLNLLNQNFIYIPYNAGPIVHKILTNYKINYKYIDQANFTNVLLAYENGFYSSGQSFNNLQSNYAFLMNFCSILNAYKDSNNLINLKYKTVKKFASLFWQTTKKTKFSEDGVETLIKNTKQFEKVGKYLKLEKIETINYLSKNYHYLFDIYYQYKYKKTTHKIKINLTYNLISKKLEIKMTSEKNDNFWIKIKEFFINKYMLMIFNFLIKKYKNNTKKTETYYEISKS